MHLASDRMRKLTDFQNRFRAAQAAVHVAPSHIQARNLEEIRNGSVQHTSERSARLKMCGGASPARAILSTAEDRGRLPSGEVRQEE
jgi:hypothetical protein